MKQQNKVIKQINIRKIQEPFEHHLVHFFVH